MSKRKKGRKPFAVKIYFLFTVCLMTITCVVLYGQYVEYKKLDIEEQKTLSLIEDQKRIYSELRIEIDNVHSDAVIEREARDKLGFLKLTEKIFIDTNKQ